MTDLKTLREVAEGADVGAWPWSGPDAEISTRLNAYLSAFDPPTAKALLDQIEALEARLDKLAVAARTHLATHPVFRQRVGDEGSRARLLQADQIATENALIAALKETPNG